MPDIFSVGYGNRSIDDLIGLLKEHDIESLVDVRSQPYSRFKPEFSKEPLAAALETAGNGYFFMGDTLGGRPESVDCYVDGKADYDRIRQKEFYQEGIEKLLRIRERVVLMCSEGKPEECHRSKLIGVTLAERGVEVIHLDEEGAPRSQTEVIARITGGQLDLFGESSFTSRKRYGTDY